MTGPWLLSLGALALLGWFLWRRAVTVPCDVDLEATQAHFHAHVELQGVAPNEGDAVVVHGMPSRLAPDEVRTFRTTATVHQATWPRRAWERVFGRTRITELYDVGFEG